MSCLCYLKSIKKSFYSKLLDCIADSFNISRLDVDFIERQRIHINALSSEALYQIKFSKKVRIKKEDPLLQVWIHFNALVFTTSFEVFAYMHLTKSDILVNDKTVRLN